MTWIAAFLFYFFCLPLVALCAIQTDKISRMELTVLSPVNNSIVGNFVEVRFHLDFFDAANLRVNPPHAEYVLEIVENKDPAMTAVLSTFVPWISIGYGPFGGEGVRQLDFQMTVVDKNPDVSPQKYFLTANVSVNTLPMKYERRELPVLKSNSEVHNREQLENDNQILYDLLHSVIPHHAELSTTVALAFDHRSTAYNSLVKLSPQIMEFFDWSAFSSSCTTTPELNFGPLFTSWQNVQENRDLQYRAYYDVAIVSFTSTRSGLVGSHQLGEMTKFLHAMKIRTSGHLVIVTTTSLMQALIDSAQSLFGSASFLTENIEQQFSYSDRVVLIFFHSVEKRVLSSAVNYKDFLGLTPAVVNQVEVSSSGRTVTKKKDQGVVTSSGEYRETQNGVNYVTLHNACVQKEGKVVVLITEGYEGPIVDHLNLADLNEFLDRAGFMPFTWVRQAIAYGGENMLFVNASAALAIPFYHHNVFHHFQSLAGLLSLQDVFSEELKFLLMPKFDSTADNQYEWSNGVLSLVTQYYERQTKQQTGSEEGLSVLFEKQYKSLFETTKSELVCFKDLVLVGQVDTNRGFFTNSSVLNKFREVSYDTYARDGAKKQTCSDDTAATAKGVEKVSPAVDGTSTTTGPLTSAVISRSRTSKREPQFNKISKYLIRVTFSLRLHNRRILNLAALHKALIESGVVDLGWLNHLEQHQLDRDGEVLFNVHSGWTYLDNMSLQDQIKIFKETDLFIGVHGSAFINAALFMQPHSVCIALMQSRHIEFVLPQIIQQAGIAFHFLPILDQNQSVNCQGSFSPDCVSGSLTRAGRMDCLPIRNCDVSVDVDWFLVLVEHAAYHIRANKRTDSWIV